MNALLLPHFDHTDDQTTAFNFVRLMERKSQITFKSSDYSFLHTYLLRSLLFRGIPSSEKLVHAVLQKGKYIRYVPGTILSSAGVNILTIGDISEYNCIKRSRQIGSCSGQKQRGDSIGDQNNELRDRQKNNSKMSFNLNRSLSNMGRKVFHSEIHAIPILEQTGVERSQSNLVGMKRSKSQKQEIHVDINRREIFQNQGNIMKNFNKLQKTDKINDRLNAISIVINSKERGRYIKSNTSSNYYQVNAKNTDMHQHPDISNTITCQNNQKDNQKYIIEDMDQIKENNHCDKKFNNNVHDIYEKKLFSQVINIHQPFQYVKESNKIIELSELKFIAISQCHIIEISFEDFLQIFECLFQQLQFVTRSLLSQIPDFPKESVSTIALHFQEQCVSNKNIIELEHHIIIIKNGFLILCMNGQLVNLSASSVLDVETSNYEIIDISYPLTLYVIERAHFHFSRQQPSPEHILVDRQQPETLHNLIITKCTKCKKNDKKEHLISKNQRNVMYTRPKQLIPKLFQSKLMNTMIKKQIHSKQAIQPSVKQDNANFIYPNDVLPSSYSNVSQVNADSQTNLKNNLEDNSFDIKSNVNIPHLIQTERVIPNTICNYHQQSSQVLLQLAKIEGNEFGEKEQHTSTSIHQINVQTNNQQHQIMSEKDLFSKSSTLQSLPKTESCNSELINTNSAKTLVSYTSQKQKKQREYRLYQSSDRIPNVSQTSPIKLLQSVQSQSLNQMNLIDTQSILRTKSVPRRSNSVLFNMEEYLQNIKTDANEPRQISQAEEIQIRESIPSSQGEVDIEIINHGKNEIEDDLIISLKQNYMQDQSKKEKVNQKKRFITTQNFNNQYLAIQIPKIGQQFNKNQSETSKTKVKSMIMNDSFSMDNFLQQSKCYTKKQPLKRNISVQRLYQSTSSQRISLQYINPLESSQSNKCIFK